MICKQKDNELIAILQQKALDRPDSLNDSYKFEHKVGPFDGSIDRDYVEDEYDFNESQSDYEQNE